MTVAQKMQAAINPKHEGWDNPDRRPTRTLEVFRVEIKKYAQLYGGSVMEGIPSNLNNGKDSYVHVVCNTFNSIIFDWVLASDSPNYANHWAYLEANARDYNVQLIKYI